MQPAAQVSRVVEQEMSYRFWIVQCQAPVWTATSVSDVMKQPLRKMFAYFLAAFRTKKTIVDRAGEKIEACASSVMRDFLQELGWEVSIFQGFSK